MIVTAYPWPSGTFPVGITSILLISLHVKVAPRSGGRHKHITLLPDHSRKQTHG